MADIFIYPSLVQGDGAEANLIAALDYFEATRLVDVIIIGRGGGSIEDLWAFNSEKLARRIFDAETPVISAVGHETDFTICDFVSDMRAPTPSAAAEIAVPDIRELILRIDDMGDRLASALIRATARKRERLDLISQSLIFDSPELIFDSNREELSKLQSAATAAIEDTVLNNKNKLSLLSEKADAMSPLSVLKRGYTVCEDEYGDIASAKKLKAGDGLKIILSDGALSATVNEVKIKRGKR